MQQADKIKGRFNGSKVDQEHVGSVIMRTRNEVRDSSSVFVAGGVVALMLE